MSDMDGGRTVDRRTVLRSLGTVMATVSVAGCSSDTPEQSTDTTTAGDELSVTVTQGTPPDTLDPHNHRSTPTENVVRQAYEGLLARDASGAVTERLATGYDRKEAGRVRFTLREDVSFHSGSTLQPADVVFSIRRIVDPSVGIESAQRDQLSGITDAEVVDGKHAVDVITEGPNPLVVNQLATYCDIVEKQWVTESGEGTVTQEMNGTGPFKQTTYEANTRVAFEPFSSYWGPSPGPTALTIDAATEASVRVNSLLEGESDLVVNVPPQEVQRIESNDASALATAPSTRILYVAMRSDVEPFDSQQFRQAMNYAVDLESIVEDILNGFGKGTGQPTLEEFVGFDDSIEPYPHDPDRAEQLIEESGHAGTSVTLHSPQGRYLKDVEIAQAVVGMIDSLSNVSADLQQRETNALIGELTDGDRSTMPHMYLIGWGNATFDATKTLIPTLGCGEVLSSFCAESLDEEVQTSLETTDQSKRQELLSAVNSEYHDLAPWIFLHQQFSVYGVDQRLEWTARRDERIEAATIARSN